MKNPWILTWWDVYKDAACKQGMPTYEAALLKQASLQRKGHCNVQIKPK